MRKLIVAAALVVANIAMVAATPTPARAEKEQKKYDYSWAYDPLTHEPVLVCVDCWFWSCDCGTS